MMSSCCLVFLNVGGVVHLVRLMTNAWQPWGLHSLEGANTRWQRAGQRLTAQEKGGFKL